MVEEKNRPSHRRFFFWHSDDDVDVLCYASEHCTTEERLSLDGVKIRVALNAENMGNVEEGEN